VKNRVPLTGADCFLRAFEGEVRRWNGASHLSQLVLRLGPGLDAQRLRALIATAGCEAPIVRAPVRRPHPLAVPVYRVDQAARAALPVVEVHEKVDACSRSAPVPGVFFERLNQQMSLARGELLRFDLVPYADGGTDLAMTWVHLLLDGAGSEGFVRWLDTRARGAAPLPGGDGLGDVSPPPMGAGRGRQAQEWQRQMSASPECPPRSLAGPLRRVRQRLRYEIVTLDDVETAAVSARAGEQAGLLTPMLFYLAAAIRAHHAVLRARCVDPRSFVVPLPVNLRPKGTEGAIFRTHVSMLWFRVAPEETESLEGLVDVLKRQRRTAIREKRIEAGVAAMDYARYAPAWIYSRMARRAFRGELGSFFFAFTDAFLPGLERFLGAPIRNGFHAPSVPASPGSSVILSLRDGRLNLTHIHQEGVLSESELALLRETLLADLRGARA
jgi:hypothetical protein